MVSKTSLKDIRSRASSEANQMVSQMTDEQVLKLLYDWNTWARPNQLIPPGEWTNWLVLAGRGFGKTRMGSEFIRYHVENKLANRIALVAEDASDARDVIVEGESGIIACSPPWMRPHYEPTKRRLTWPNGAQATIYADADPESLRGPQHDLYWCFVAGTRIETPGGRVNIEDITPGTVVISKDGPRAVTVACCTGEKDVYELTLSNGTILVGTQEHPIWTKNRGWVHLRDINPCDIMLSYTEWRSEWERQHLKGLSSTPEEIMVTPHWLGGMRYYIDLFGFTLTAPFRRVMLYITSILTAPIMIYQTSGACERKTTIGYITNNHQTLLGLKSKVVSYVVSSLNQRYTTRPHAVKYATGKFPGLKRYAYIVGGRLKRILRPINIVLENAFQLPILGINALSAKPRCHIGAKPPSIVPLNVESLRKLEKRQAVYNLTVSGSHTYFANGILVHNCDELAKYPNLQTTWDNLMFGLRLGKKPRGIITTTPRPVQLIRKLIADTENTFVTRGSTFDNRANLADSFFREIISKYEGTTLGRQELYAELIDPEESGIVKRSWFKLWPANKPLPHFEFVIQSYDTAFTDKTENDPTACTVWGIFDDGKKLCAMLIDAWSEHIKYPMLRERLSKEFYSTMYGDSNTKASLVLIEDKGSGIALLQELRGTGVPVAPYNPGRADKMQRLHSVSNLMYNGLVYVPESPAMRGEIISWANEMMEQLCCFPAVDHDDYVDSTSQALALLRDQQWLTVDLPDEDDVESYKSPIVNPYAV